MNKIEIEVFGQRAWGDEMEYSYKSSIVPRASEYVETPEGTFFIHKVRHDVSRGELERVQVFGVRV